MLPTSAADDFFRSAGQLGNHSDELARLWLPGNQVDGATPLLPGLGQEIKAAWSSDERRFTTELLGNLQQNGQAEQSQPSAVPDPEPEQPLAIACMTECGGLQGESEPSGFFESILEFLGELFS